MLEEVEKAPTASSPKGIKRDSKFTPNKKASRIPTPQVEIEGS